MNVVYTTVQGEPLSHASILLILVVGQKIAFFDNTKPNGLRASERFKQVLAAFGAILTPRL